MNRFLAASVGWINALMAWLSVALGVIAGFGNAGEFQVKPAVGAVVGGALGFLFAFYLCGLLSLFVEIRKELVKIGAILADGLRSSRNDAERSVGGAEPGIEW